MLPFLCRVTPSPMLDTGFTRRGELDVISRDSVVHSFNFNCMIPSYRSSESIFDIAYLTTRGLRKDLRSCSDAPHRLCLLKRPALSIPQQDPPSPPQPKSSLEYQDNKVLDDVIMRKMSTPDCAF